MMDEPMVHDNASADVDADTCQAFDGNLRSSHGDDDLLQGMNNCDMDANNVSAEDEDEEDKPEACADAVYAEDVHLQVNETEGESPEEEPNYNEREENSQQDDGQESKPEESLGSEHEDESKEVNSDDQNITGDVDEQGEAEFQPDEENKDFEPVVELEADVVKPVLDHPDTSPTDSGIEPEEESAAEPEQTTMEEECTDPEQTNMEGSPEPEESTMEESAAPEHMEQSNEPDQTTMEESNEPEEITKEESAEPEEPVMELSVEPEEAVVEPSVEPEEAVVQPSVEPEEAVVEPSVEPEEAVVQPNVEPEKTPEEPSAEPEEAVVQPSAEPEQASVEESAGPEESVIEPSAEPEETPEEPVESEPEPELVVCTDTPADTPADESAPVKSPDPAKTLRIEELEKRVNELETTLRDKDETITSLQTEVERLNTEIKTRSVPAAKKPAGPKGDARAKTVGARAPAASKPAPRAGAKPMTNGFDKKPTTPRKAPAGRPKTAPAKAAPKNAPTKTKASPNKKASGGKSATRLEKSGEGEDNALKLSLRGRGIVCYPPTNYNENDYTFDKPEEKLKINWVYGYRGRDSQDNIFSLPSNELLYYQAALGVLYDPATRTQRFYQGHNDDIKCIALNPTDNNIIATGQAAGHDEKEGDPHVRVWNCETLQDIAVLGMGTFQRGVGSVSFSPDGSKLLCVDEGNDHTIYLYDWNKKNKITSQKGHQDPVLGAEFLPNNNNRFITYGKGHIIFWEIEGNKLIKKSGLFEKHAKARFITALAFTDAGDPITGDSSGNVNIWNPAERKISISKPGAHEGTVYSIAVKDDVIYTGGQDCKVKMFKCDLSEVDSWQLDGQLHGRVKAIAFCGDQLAVGTYNNGMLLGSFGAEPDQIIYGHGAGDLWGGTNHPSENRFATAGQDKVVYIWDAASHTPHKRFTVDKPAQACAFSPCGSVLAVASTTGEWWVHDSESGEVLSTYKSGPEQIDAMAYSPDGTKIAVGSHDNFVYVFSCDDLKSEYTLMGRCTGHSSFITHLDFSEDGKTLQTTSGDYEHLFWDVETCDQVTNTKDLRDVTMATYTCILGFPVCGVWPPGYDGTDINSCARSHDSKIVATSDDFGLVNLFRYPCCSPKAEWDMYRGHSAHVTKVRFLVNDKELFSLGGRDQSIIQWGVN